MDVKVIEELNKKYHCELAFISNKSKNYHYSGQSEQLNKRIFVKFYKSKRRYQKELSLLEVVENPVLLDSLEYENYYAIVLEYCDMQDVNEISAVEAYEYGKLLGRFHKASTKEKAQQIKTISGESSTLFTKIDDIMSKIHSHEKYEQVLRIYNELSEFKAIYQEEYDKLPKMVIHGDFGLRNIKLVKNTPILIDFERSKYDIAWMDLMKFFNREVSDESLQVKFLEGYQEEYSIEVPSPILQKVLEFYTAIGIYYYTMEIQDLEFRLMGEKIIDKLEEFCSYLRILKSFMLITVGDALGVAGTHYSYDDILEVYGSELNEIKEKIRYFGLKPQKMESW